MTELCHYFMVYFLVSSMSVSSVTSASEESSSTKKDEREASSFTSEDDSDATIGDKDGKVTCIISTD